MKRFLKFIVIPSIIFTSLDSYAGREFSNGMDKKDDPYDRPNYDRRYKTPEPEYQRPSYVQHNINVRDKFLIDYQNGYYYWLSDTEATLVYQTLSSEEIINCGEPMNIEEIISNYFPRNSNRSWRNWNNFSEGFKHFHKHFNLAYRKFSKTKSKVAYLD